MNTKPIKENRYTPNYILSPTNKMYMTGDGNYFAIANDIIYNKILPPMSSLQAQAIFLPLTRINWWETDELTDIKDGIQFKAIDFIYAVGAAPAEICECSNLTERRELARSDKYKGTGAMKACYTPGDKNNGNIKEWIEDLYWGKKVKKDGIYKRMDGVVHLTSRPVNGIGGFNLVDHVNIEHGYVTIYYSEKFLPYISEFKESKKHYATVNAGDFSKITDPKGCMWYLAMSVANGSLVMSTSAIKGFLGLGGMYQHEVASKLKDGTERKTSQFNRTPFEQTNLTRPLEEISEKCKYIRIYQNDEDGLYFTKDKDRSKEREAESEVINPRKYRVGKYHINYKKGKHYFSNSQYFKNKKEFLNKEDLLDEYEEFDD